MTTVHDIETILAYAGHAFDGGSAKRRSEIADEWAEEFGTSPREVREIQDWINDGWWDAGSARMAKDAGYHPGRDTLRVKEERAGRVGVDGPVYHVCNGDIGINDCEW